MDKISIVKRLKNNHKIVETIDLLLSGGIDESKIGTLKKEHDLNDRTIRPTQVEKVQKDKIIKVKAPKPGGEKGETTEISKLVKSVRTIVSFQKRIVRLSSVFEVGGGVNLLPSEENDLTKEIKKLWVTLRLNSILYKATKLTKKELQSAILFYIKDHNTSKSFISRLIGDNSRKEIKTKILENKDGEMKPYFDGFGDMVAFIWKFKTKVDNKDVNNVWVYLDDVVIKCDDGDNGLMIFKKEEKHGFDRIPIVYLNQDKEEWYDVKSLIDRFEVSLSKLGNSNDYSGHPLLKIVGEVKSLPDKNADGKVLSIQQQKDADGKIIGKGDASFLTHDNAPESVNSELDRLERLIYTITSTPDISFENLKGIGNISGVALKIMFLDPVLKALDKLGDNKTAVLRMVNIMISGIVTTLNHKYKAHAKNVYYDAEFNSVIPNDLKEAIDILSTAVQGGFMSIDTAVEKADMASDTKREIDLLKQEKESKNIVE